MRGAILLLFVGLFLSGCLVQAQEPIRAYDTSATFEPSMLPNFGKDAGPWYRFILIHQHVMPSPEEEREWNQPGGRGRVVCFRLDGVTAAELLGPSEGAEKSRADVAAARICNPTIDPGRGRLFLNRTEFDRASPMGIAVTDECSGQGLTITHREPGFVAQGPAHAFRAEFLANDTLLVDGRWYVEPGRTLKVEYVAAGPKAGADDDRRVKMVFDYAGFWLVANVGELGPGEEVLPPRPTEGNGPEAWVPRQPHGVAQILGPLLDESRGQDEKLRSMRLTGTGGNLTDLRIALSGAERIEWFVAGGNATHLRLLGNVMPDAPGPTIARDRFEAAFRDVDLRRALSPDDAVVEIRWTPDLALKSNMPVAWSETWVQVPGACEDGCVWVWTSTPTEPASWRLVSDPTTVAAQNALTLTISLGRGSELHLGELYHRPA